jgi:transposase-like protein
MSMVMEDEIKRWTARRKSTLVLEIIQGKTTVAEASRAYDLPPSEIESWIEDGKKGMENALRANPQDVREQYEQQLKDLQEAYGEAMLELRAQKNCSLCWTRKRNDRDDPPGTQRERLYRLDQSAVPLVRSVAKDSVLPAYPQAASGPGALQPADQTDDR